ncbi:hypothetical protein J2X48_000733 [Bosea sp. BE271]|uniref:hypothetical protein n=1 Tax=Bosea TaxID=85413 RepID=UPI0028616098|nr:MULTISPECIES: hypothetical protein [Bosea]MDR6826463.1 hypothetical protein [Bosea robiniae]MDR6893173.1 hypothetical protein [Bosea sp. BE109]MDR7137128.1 hypothetical protein [Bosea sp. BE168]MDR7173827.1 hypothetical protein [Bosea sp. BE271]
MGDRALSQLSPEEFDIVIDGRRRARMEAIDALSPEHRELVHDYGYNVVRACMDCGATKPKHIRHIVETVLNEFSPTRGSYASQGVRAIR